MKKLVKGKNLWIFLSLFVSFLPMILVSKDLPLTFTILNTIPIIWRIFFSTISLIFTAIFIKTIIYLFLVISTITLSVAFLSNEKITVWRFRLSEKRTFWQLFLGYFFLFFPFYYTVRMSIFERVPLKESDFFIWSTLIGLTISILFIMTRYLIKNNVKMGDSLPLGNFFLLIFASTIILQAFELYAPQFSSIKIFLEWGISTENEQLNAMANYYYPLMFSAYSSIFDYYILKRRN
jgi:hypothetical protein